VRPYSQTCAWCSWCSSGHLPGVHKCTLYPSSKLRAIWKKQKQMIFEDCPGLQARLFSWSSIKVIFGGMYRFRRLCKKNTVMTWCSAIRAILEWPFGPPLVPITYCILNPVSGM
jgi:hypothetical protein